MQLCLAVALLLAFPNSAHSEEVIAHAFAKASPLLVYESADLGASRSAPFEFGRAYDVLERTSKYVRITGGDGKPVFVKPAHVLVVGTPDYVTSTPSYRIAGRNMISLWQSSSMLGEFLTGEGSSKTQWDYREAIGAAPNFDLKLPVFSRDTLELLDGSRQVEIAGVLMPISRRMADSFKAVMEGPSGKLNLHFVLDVSESTKDFLEPALEQIVRTVSSNGDVLKRIGSVDVTTFSSGGSPRADYTQAVALEGVRTRDWRYAGSGVSRGESEPLALAMETLLAGLPKPGDSAAAERPIIIVLAGADVDLANTVSTGGRIVKASFDGLDAKAVKDGIAIFAQVTPEPGVLLQRASTMVPELNGRYLGFSADVGQRAAQQIIGLVEQNKDAEKDVDDFGDFVKAASAERMMAFLPRRLTADAALPRPQGFAEESDWYSVPLWVPLDGLVLKAGE